MKDLFLKSQLGVRRKSVKSSRSNLEIAVGLTLNSAVAVNHKDRKESRLQRLQFGMITHPWGVPVSNAIARQVPLYVFFVLFVVKWIAVFGLTAEHAEYAEKRAECGFEGARMRAHSSQGVLLPRVPRILRFHLPFLDLKFQISNLRFHQNSHSKR